MAAPTRKESIEKMQRAMESFGIVLEDTMLKQFMQYYEVLVQTNKVMNLTAITEFDEVLMKHFVDSVSLAKVVSCKGQSILDIGTGAGFPGVPLKIVFPSARVTLLDELQKRVC